MQGGSPLTRTFSIHLVHNGEAEPRELTAQAQELDMGY